MSHTEVQQPAKLYWLATYGDMGLVVTHYTDRKQWEHDCRKAENDHANDEIDSYTFDEV